MVVMLALLVARRSLISCKMASWESMCGAFTLKSMFDVSAVKIMKSSFLFFTATLVVLILVFFSCFSMMNAHHSSAFAAQMTTCFVTNACHLSMELVTLSNDVA
jgi:hypothetical protein